MRKLQVLGCVVFGSILFVGCSKSDSTSTTTTSAAVPTDPVLAKMNALVPNDLRSVLQFESVTFRGDANGDGSTDLDERMHAYVPKGWMSHEEFNGMTGMFYSRTNAKADASIFDRLGKSRLDVDNECDGMCEPKDWSKVADKHSNAVFGDGTPTKEETLPHGGHIRWGTYSDHFGRHGAVYATWITSGARVMPTCEFTIDDEALLPAMDAFAEACKASQKF